MQVNSLVKIEAKKKYEFLESLSAIMDAHLRYFKLVCFLIVMIFPPLQVDVILLCGLNMVDCFML